MSIDSRVLKLERYFNRVRTQNPDLFSTRQRLENGLVKVSEKYQERLDSMFYYVLDSMRDGGGNKETRRLLAIAIKKGYNPRKLVSYLREDYSLLRHLPRKSEVQSKSL